ncbi:MAG: dihydrolipoyllysine-residue acetyltransferase [Candidatus Eremiobacteraeota bacterium]|nr:dihydrolipoyllysine-residue acetyltransferase [Candidatus Eremiobacteraeota bacterium]
MSTIDVKVPNIGDFKDVPIIDVLVKPGDKVEADAPLVTIESEKASMDVPSPSSGVVQALAVKIGDKVSEGSSLLTLAAGNGAPAAAAPAQPPPASPAPSGALEVRVPNIGDFKDVPIIDVLVHPGEDVQADAPLVTIESEKASMDVPSPSAGKVQSLAVKIGDKVSEGSLLLTLAALGAAPAAPASAPPPAAPQKAEEPKPAEPSRDGEIVHASPSIRRLAREFGIGLADVRGSGPHGRITKEDLQSFVKRALGGAAPAAPAGGVPFNLPAWPKVDFAQFGPIERTPLPRIKRISGPSLHRNWISIPHVTNNDEADITELEAFRKQLNAEDPNAKVTILAFAIKAVVAALKRFPEFNASLDGDELVLKRYYNIGFAADTPQGLIVPVLKDADKKGVLQIAAETRELAAKGRDGKLALAEMQGGTFTISSLGGIGGTSFSPIVNAPEVAILGLSRSSMKPVWDGKAFVPRLILPLSLSYDHRVIDGALGARFNAYLAALLADMRRTML